MKVFIITEGGSNIGFGHVTRCISLHQAFEERGIIPEFIVNGDEAVEYLLEDKNYIFINWLEKKEELLDSMEEVTIAIIDSYLADVDFYSTISKGVAVPMYIDDNKRLDYPRGIVLNGSVGAEKIAYPQREGTTYLLGTQYMPLREDFWNVSKKKINKNVKNILITFGGISYSNLIYAIVNYLRDKFGFNFYVVEPQKDNLNAKKIIDLMLKADICVSGGGQTTYELARVGVPTIGICFAENQRLNLEGWQDKGFIEYIGWYNDENLLSKLIGALNKLLSYQERIRRSNRGTDTIDGEGTKRIVSQLLNKSKSGIEVER